MSGTDTRETSLDLRWQWLILLVAVGGILYLLSGVLTPFVVAALFAYLMNPAVGWLQRRGIGRSFAASLVFIIVTLIVVAIIVLLVPFIERQIGNLLTNLPVWVDWIQSHAGPWLEAHWGLSLNFLDPHQLINSLQENWKTAGGFAAGVLSQVSRSGLTIVAWILNLVLIPVVAFYLLRDWHVMIERIHSMIPRTIEPVVSRLARESDQVLAAFVRGQLTVMIVLGTFYAVGLWMCGLSVGPLIGMIAGLISFVPYLGATTGAIMAVTAVLVQYHDWFHLLIVAAVFVVGQLLEGYVLVPQLVGDKIGLHPVAVIFAVLAGGELFGFLGVLLALPVASVLVVVLRYAYERYQGSELYRGEDPATPVIAVAASDVESGAPAVSRGGLADDKSFVPSA